MERGQADRTGSWASTSSSAHDELKDGDEEPNKKLGEKLGWFPHSLITYTPDSKHVTCDSKYTRLTLNTRLKYVRL